MLRSRVSKRYAKALFELAREKDILTRVEDDLRGLLEEYEQSDKLQILLHSPVIQVSEKKKFLKEFFENKVHPVTFNLLLLLLEKNREGILPQIAERFMELQDEAQGILRGQLITAHPFSEKQLAEAKEKLDHLTQKNVILSQEIDAGLIGGFIIRMQDTVIDSSLRHQLSKMHESMIAGK
ncbi:MAG: ATP synthase F1 subunit delta [Calditrichia bacterium]